MDNLIDSDTMTDANLRERVNGMNKNSKMQWLRRKKNEKGG